MAMRDKYERAQQKLANNKYSGSWLGFLLIIVVAFIAVVGKMFILFCIFVESLETKGS
jgi:hypothetical protein